MIYQTTSIEEVLARVVRNTRLQDATYLRDMEEWIPEAMGYMKTRYAMKLVWEDVKVRNHKARMPCGLQSVSGIEYCGCRLRYFNASRAADSAGSTSDSASVYPGIPLKGTTIFGTHLIRRPAIDEGVDVTFLTTDLKSLDNLEFHGEHWYYIELGYLNTSFECGSMRVHYRRMPVDAKGLPLIPDNELYKEALYWYSRAKMIGAGYTDKIFTEDTCMQRFDSYAQKAVSAITYPTVDQVQDRLERMTRFILPLDYWSTFFNPAAEHIQS